MSTIRIPGGTATLRDKLVSERHHRLLEAAYMAASSAMVKVQATAVTEDMSPEEQSAAVAGAALTMHESAALLDLQDAAIVAFLEHWSLKRPLPTIDNVSDLDRDLYKALAEGTKGLAAGALATTLDFEPKAVKTDPESGLDFPTGESSVSDGLSTDAQPSQLTVIPSTSGESTVTESFIPG